MSLTGVKDLDREILKRLTEENLVKIWLVDKKMYYNICDDEFLRKRLTKYREVEMNKFKKESWKRFFCRVSLCVLKMKNNYNFEYSGGRLLFQYTLLKTHMGTKLMLEAAINGELSLVKYCFNSNYTSLMKNSMLCQACSRGHVQIVKYLTEEQQTYVHENEDEALMEAVDGNHLEVVKYLIEHGADIHARENDALYLASGNGHLQMLSYINSLL